MLKDKIQIFGLALITAVAGFSYALATAPDMEEPREVLPTPRAVGGGLRISNPTLLAGQDPLYPTGGLAGSAVGFMQGFDLGDACYGSAIVRYITAVGGVEPWLFKPVAVGSTTLNVDPMGRVSGTLPPVAGTSIQHITASVSDRTGASQTGTFSLFGFPSSTTPFRFAHDRLSTARVGQDYTTNIQVLNGDPARIVFSVVPGSVTLNGIPQSNLSNVGFQLYEDGNLAGRPLMSGTMTFIARATVDGKNALNRQATSPDQPLTLSIEKQNSIQSILATTASGIAINPSRSGTDGFNLTALFNSDGLSSTDLAGLSVTLRIGTKTFVSQNLDQNGNSRFGNMQVRTRAPLGSLSITLRHQNFGNLFETGTTLADGSVRNVPIEIQIGNQYLGTETLEYSVSNRRGKIVMRYKLNTNRQVGGLCQVLSVKGANLSDGTVAFRTKVLVAPLASQGSSLTNADSAVVNIGPKFTDALVLSNGRGIFASPGVAAFSIRGKTVTIVTYGLSPSETGISPSNRTSGSTQDFNIGLHINAGSVQYFGEATRRIFPF